MVGGCWAIVEAPLSRVGANRSAVLLGGSIPHALLRRTQASPIWETRTQRPLLLPYITPSILASPYISGLPWTGASNWGLRPVDNNGSARCRNGARSQCFSMGRRRRKTRDAQKQTMERPHWKLNQCIIGGVTMGWGKMTPQSGDCSRQIYETGQDLILQRPPF